MVLVLMWQFPLIYGRCEKRMLPDRDTFAPSRILAGAVVPVYCVAAASNCVRGKHRRQSGFRAVLRALGFILLLIVAASG
jgi:hypothetical protein